MLAVPATANAAPTDGGGSTNRFTPAPAGAVDHVPASVDDSGTVKVVVELTGDPVAVAQTKAERKLSSAERAEIRSKLKSQQDALLPAIKARGGKVVSQMQSAINGIGVDVPRKDIPALQALPGVAEVRGVTRYRLDNATSIPYLGVPQVWQNTGKTGAGVKVAVIDTGIDYTHLNLGGPGTAAAWNDAHTNEAAPPKTSNGWGVRVKGGWDFVGDAYDADQAGSTPKPDSNPVDCNGHGSHVAGTIGGNGVNADGTKYTGPYDASTPSHPFHICPGVAPAVDLYALKVFGCEGTTNVVVEAIDWAVANDMDVVNMSLGSPYGSVNDADAVAASNAVASGVVVVASAGNEGNNPYLVGSPSTGRGVISVAANDSTAAFPGASLTVGGQSIDAINANQVNPLPSGPLTVVVLKDDPNTAENEALGCSVAAYTKAGITAGGNQIAVSTRGTCARVARAVFGQQAGAAAVVMVNNAADYPPVEGPITENPDTGEKYTVTIPFLGVRDSDGAFLAAADGKPLTMTAKSLTNPGYTKAASFSSGGPRTGDSGLKPSVVAPGVSIVSTGVGTGNGPATISGTSMAAPHVSGVAALTVQAHRGWSAGDIASTIVNTANPGKVGDYRLTLTGQGQVDPAAAVAAQVVARTDPYRVNGATRYEQTLSFGFAESSRQFTGVKTITLVNRGRQSVTYRASAVATPQSRPASVRVYPSVVWVPAGHSAVVTVVLSARATDIGSSLGDDQWAFKEISGSVLFKGSGGGDLRVPYLMVPRASANLTASVNGNINPRSGGATVSLANRGGALPAAAEVFTWGLADARRDQLGSGNGYDLRAAGVQSIPDGNDQLLVFAVNNWDRYSNAAANEYDVNIDTTGDGKPDYVVYSVDYGLVTAGDPDGQNVVFLYNVATAASTPMFYAVSPTDSSTIELPVYASDLGLSPDHGTFAYTVASYSILDSSWGDEFDGAAQYNPWHKAMADGQQATVKVNGTARVQLPIDKTVWGQRTPLGAMIVSIDNPAASEATLISARR